MATKAQVAPVACEALTWVGPTPWAGAHLICTLSKYSPQSARPLAFDRAISNRAEPCSQSPSRLAALNGA